MCECELTHSTGYIEIKGHPGRSVLTLCLRKGLLLFITVYIGLADLSPSRDSCFHFPSCHKNTGITDMHSCSQPMEGFHNCQPAPPRETTLSATTQCSHAVLACGFQFSQSSPGQPSSPPERLLPTSVIHLSPVVAALLPEYEY